MALVAADGTVLDRYVYGTSPYVPDYFVRTSGPDVGTYRLLKDERGSVRLIVNASSGAVLQQLTYDAFGRVLFDSNPGFTPFGFAGGLWDGACQDSCPKNHHETGVAIGWMRASCLTGLRYTAPMGDAKTGELIGFLEP